VVALVIPTVKHGLVRRGLSEKSEQLYAFPGGSANGTEVVAKNLPGVGLTGIRVGLVLAGT